MRPAPTPSTNCSPAAGLTWNDGRYDATVIQKHYAAMDESNWVAQTIASAIEIGRPVNLPKALRALHFMNGVVREVSDDEILEHRAMVARWGFGCEPASRRERGWASPANG